VGGIFGIAAPSETGNEQIIEHFALVVERAQVQSLLEQARALLLVDEGVVNRGTAIWY